MQRKNTYVILGLLMALSLTACGSVKEFVNGDNSDECEVVCPCERPDGSDDLDSTDLYITFNGVDIKSTSDAAELLKELGEPSEQSEYLYCGTQDYAHVYSYDSGVEFGTYPSDGVDKIEYITLTANGSLSNGLQIGDSKDKVTELLGDDGCDDETGDYYNYQNASLSVSYEDGKVATIYIYFYE